MTPDVVVDVGNTRIKWGRCGAGRIAALAALPPHDAGQWQKQADAWSLPPGAKWVLSGVHPARRTQLAEWLRAGHFEVYLLDCFQHLPLPVQVEHPERVGMDRLLNAVAANARRNPGEAAIIVDAGSAVTVDLVDAAGAFRGGAILPGLGLMAKALRDFTAQLPLVDMGAASQDVYPGTSTEKAMRLGILNAAAGGIERLIEKTRAKGNEVQTYLTGGDAEVLARALDRKAVLWPEMTLEGICLSAEGI